MIARPTVVPHIVCRDGEEPGLESELAVLPNGRGVRYRDEQPQDRDTHGVLWGRIGTDLGGRPLFAKPHVRRQRDLMQRMLCQVCTRPASRTTDGTLFLLPSQEERWAGWPEGGAVEHPPLCLTCAPISVEQCPRLRAGHVAVRAGKARLWGVSGCVYGASWNGLEVRNKDVELPYGHLAMRWMVAAYLRRELRQCREVDLAEEVARAGQAPTQAGDR
ncbi:hypothetical protein [Streptomyces sp. RPT161]|uniref:hypothetical protein n=1 Tax=Streptomyces sp. RPT161 TaxID=3015993 RepID=UPI0022B858E4|nr:hypothetical protein [Streptomyces sp. RPT161]